VNVWRGQAEHLADSLATGADIALLYRALCEGREASKDEPGVATSTMARWRCVAMTTVRPGPKRLVMWLYWLVAGYPQGQ
jgi:hypothetical protein